MDQKLKKKKRKKKNSAFGGGTGLDIEIDISDTVDNLDKVIAEAGSIVRDRIFDDECQC